MLCLIVTVACDSNGSSIGNCSLNVMVTSCHSIPYKFSFQLCVYVGGCAGVRACVSVGATIHARFADTVIAPVLV